MSDITKEQLVAFTDKMISIYESGKIKAPVHFSKDNEDSLIEIFKDIKPTDWVFSTWRSHYHALLHGVPEELVEKEILLGHSITLQFPEYNFYTSAIVGSIAPMATGVALSFKLKNNPGRVWCFCGDMGARTGIFYESVKYAEGHDLPITFVIEDNELSVDTDTKKVWGDTELINSSKIIHYNYKRSLPHMGSGTFINF
jgi:pyruvate dehydrogenase E1 component alpha subunit